MQIVFSFIHHFFIKNAYMSIIVPTVESVQFTYSPAVSYIVCYAAVPAGKLFHFSLFPN